MIRGKRRGNQSLPVPLRTNPKCLPCAHPHWCAAACLFGTAVPKHPQPGSRATRYFLWVVSCCPLLPCGETRADGSITTERLHDTHTIIPWRWAFSPECPISEATAEGEYLPRSTGGTRPDALPQDAAVPVAACPLLCPGSQPHLPLWTTCSR